MDDSRSGTHQSRFWWIAVSLAALNIAVYAQLASHQFINFDDDWYVAANPHVNAGLTWAGVRWAFMTIDYFYWQPLTWLSHMLDCQIFGLNAGGHHITSLILHIANALLVFVVLRRMTGLEWRSGIVAALFSLHPLTVETVAWAAERKSLLSGLFWLLATLAYVRWVEQPSGARYRWVMFGLVAGLMAKPVLVTLPIALLLLDYWPLRRPEWQNWNGISRLIAEKFPLILLAGMSSLMTFVGGHRMGAMAFLGGVTPAMRAANALYSYVRYLELTLWPTGLAILYPFDRGLALWKGAVAGGFLTAVTVAAFLARNARPYFLAGWLWFLVVLLPMIGLVPVGAQAMADRFSYLPLIGVFVMLVWGLGDALAAQPKIAAALAGVVIALCAATTWVEAAHWKDSITVFQRAVDVTRGNALAEYHLGEGLQQQGRLAEAVPHYRESARITPAFFLPYFDLGTVLSAQGNLEEAANSFRQTVLREPEFAPGQYQLGMTLVRLGRRSEAAEPLREALKLGISPEWTAEARKNLE